MVRYIEDSLPMDKNQVQELTNLYSKVIKVSGKITKNMAVEIIKTFQHRNNIQENMKTTSFMEGENSRDGIMNIKVNLKMD